MLKGQFSYVQSFTWNVSQSNYKKCNRKKNIYKNGVIDVII